MQQYPKYKFNVSDLVDKPSTPWSEAETNKIIGKIFQEWAESSATVEDKNFQIRLFANLIEHTEGQSSARVFALTFAEKDRAEQPKCSFILRVHEGELVEDTAKSEQKIAELLASTGSEIFSSSLLNVKDIPLSLVVYRHAGDQVDNDTKPLQKQIIEILKSKDEDALTRIETQIEHLIRGLLQAYDEISSPKSIVSGNDYFDRISDRIVPDIIIVADERVSIQAERITVLTEDGSQPSADRFIEPTTLSKLTEFLNEGSIPISKWVSVKVTSVSDPQIHYNYVRLRDIDTTLWLRSNDINDIGDKIKDGQQFKLVFKPNELSMKLGVSSLKSLGYTEDAYISRTDFGVLCSDIDSISHTLRHNDLHVGNILYSKERLK